MVKVFRKLLLDISNQGELLVQALGSQEARVIKKMVLADIY